MNSLLHFYKRFGIASKKVAEKLQKKTPVFKGMKPILKQTPGRAQYYYADTLHLIPESVLYKIRMPKIIPISQESTIYNDVVDKHIVKYLEHKFDANLFAPGQGLNLDLTVGQVRQMLRASEKSFKRANSGELQDIIDREKEIGERVDQEVDKINDILDDLEDKISVYRKKTFEMFVESPIPSSRNITDLIPGFGRSYLHSCIEDAENALDDDQHNEDLQEIMKRLYFIAKAENDLTLVRLELVNYWNEYNITHTYDKVTFNEAHAKHEVAKKLFERFPRGTKWENEESPFTNNFQTIFDEKLPTYKQYASDYESARSKKDNFYSTFVNEDSYDLNPDKFKEDLIAYLSGAIVVKENRFRYQQEQYDRFLTFMRWVPMFDNMTLKDFSRIYARSLRGEVDLSYNYVCPKIDANYDEYGERNVNPINATVFYYFFSAHKMKRKWAQVILSAARYPNEKIRRAYLRFFSNA